jgi:hypothetical protein
MFIVLFYSKYSQFSKNIIQTINSSQIDFVNNFKLKFVCIDNEALRKRILSSKKIIIKSVPCILVVYDNGAVEKYDDYNAFKWIDEIITKYSTKNNVEVVVEENPIVIKNEKKNKKVEIKPKETETKEKLKNKLNNKVKNKVTTPIEELDTESENENDNLSDNLNDNEIIDDIIETTNNEKPNALTIKKNDLMSLATEMQKSRETIDKNISRPEIGSIR